MITEDELADRFETAVCGTCAQQIRQCRCSEPVCSGWKHDGPLTSANGEYHVAYPRFENPEKCPACPVELDVDDLAGQIHHMRTRHPEIIEERLRGILRSGSKGNAEP